MRGKLCKDSQNGPGVEKKFILIPGRPVYSG